LKASKIRIYERIFFKLQQVQCFAMIFNDDAFVSAVMADTRSMINLVCLVMKTQLVMLQES